MAWKINKNQAAKPILAFSSHDKQNDLHKEKALYILRS